jgi:hypothetical protein
LGIVRVTGKKIHRADVKHFHDDDDRRDRSQDTPGSVDGREQQAQDAKELDADHRHPDPMGDRSQGRQGSFGMAEFPKSPHGGMGGQQNLKDPKQNVHFISPRFYWELNSTPYLYDEPVSQTRT